jgi:hypothetical protein
LTGFMTTATSASANTWAHRTITLLALCVCALTACGAPPQRLNGQTITVQTFRDADSSNGQGICELDPADRPERFALQISARSSDGQLADADEANTLVWRGEQPPALPITITLAVPSGAAYDIGVIDTLVITQSSDTQPGVVINTYNNGVCRSMREFNAAIEKFNSSNASSTAGLRAILLLLASACAGSGLLTLLKGDWAWEMHVEGQRWRGIVNLERTDEWEVSRMISGIALLVCAAVLSAVAFGSL